MSRPIIVALRALKLGDLLVAVPALRGLRRGRPEHRLILACPQWLAPLVDLIDPAMDVHPTDGLEAPLEIERVDIAVNLHGRGPQSHALLDHLDPRERMGFAAPGWHGPDWVEDVHERERWVSLLAWYGIEADPLDIALPRPTCDVARFGAGPGSAVVHVGAAHGSRHWPIERFARVTEHLTERGMRVILTGSDAERRRAEQVVEELAVESCRVEVVAGRTSLLEYAAIIADADLVVSADTGAAHLASAFGRPSVILFGPSPPERWGPPPGPHRVLTAAHLRRGDLFAEDPDPALLAVGAGEVIAAIGDLLQSHAHLSGFPDDRSHGR